MRYQGLKLGYSRGRTCTVIDRVQVQSTAAGKLQRGLAQAGRGYRCFVRSSRSCIPRTCTRYRNDGMHGVYVRKCRKRDHREPFPTTMKTTRILRVNWTVQYDSPLFTRIVDYLKNYLDESGNASHVRESTLLWRALRGPRRGLCNPFLQDQRCKYGRCLISKEIFFPHYIYRKNVSFKRIDVKMIFIREI